MNKSVLLVALIFSISFNLFADNSPFIINEGGLNIYFDFFESNILKNRLVLPENYKGDRNISDISKESDLEVALHLTGNDREAHFGSKLVGSMPGMVLNYHDISVTNIERGKRYVITLMTPNRELKVESIYEFFDRTNCVRRYSRVTNLSKKRVGIEFLSSALVNNIGSLGTGSFEDKLLFYRAYSGWKAEARWQLMSASQMGYGANGEFQLSAATITNIGSMSSVKDLPMGVVVNKEVGLSWFWQIEHNGSWHWEFSDVQTLGQNASSNNQVSSYMYIGGPDENHHNAWKELFPGETYETVRVAIGSVIGGFDEAVAALTRYRRSACLSFHQDNKNVPVIFNDYMNCLFGNPTTEKELPLIKSAAEVGCDYYVVDCGWYAEINKAWWNEVGMWLPSKTRWSNGFKALMDSIRSNGMIPGLWLEIERVGINSPLKSKPDSWFFSRHGKRVIVNNSYQLDFRNPEVREYADRIVDRIVKEYGVGYIKMDYNINIGIGTDYKADSPGQGMLEHQRAYINWLKEIYQKYPDLVIENCGSGGCRMDYAMLSVNQIQSSSDQTDYKKYPSILVGTMASVLPEQLAVWSYPQKDDTAEATSFNMVSSMLCRIHQSGHLADINKESLNQVKAGIKLYKEELSKNIPKSIPYFPTGMPKITDMYSPISLGLDCGGIHYIAVWRLAGDKTVEIPVDGEAELIYPCNLNIQLNRFGSKFSVNFPKKYMACIVKINKSTSLDH